MTKRRKPPVTHAPGVRMTRGEKARQRLVSHGFAMIATAANSAEDTLTAYEALGIIRGYVDSINSLLLVDLDKRR